MKTLALVAAAAAVAFGLSASGHSAAPAARASAAIERRSSFLRRDGRKNA